ncbi:MAG: rhodanese-like domain-containing protein [Acidobacteriota bacterium]
MRNLLIILALVAAAIFVLACSKTDASSPAHQTVAETTSATPDPNFSPAPIYTAPERQPVQDDAPRISLADAKKDYDDGAAVIVDVRAEDIYKQEHVKGSINMTFENMKEKAKSLPKDKKIITYCSCPAEHSAAAMVLELKKKGFKNVFAMLGGTLAWKNAGYPMESGQ